jgi:hypothetical protein
VLAMPKFTLANLLRVLAVFADVLSIIYVLYNIKDMSIHNPAISILFYSVLATILFFLVPFLFNKMKTLPEKIMISIISALLVISIIAFWIYKTNTIEKNLIYNNKKPSIQSLDTSKKPLIKSVIKDKPFVNLHIRKPIHKTHQKSDTLKPQVVQKTGDGGVNVNGNGNQVANGSFDGGKNNVYSGPVFVGNNININDEKKISQPVLNKIFSYVDYLIKNKSYSIENVEIITTEFYNAPLVKDQIIDYFNQRGYLINSGGMMFSSIHTFNGIIIDTPAYRNPKLKKIAIYLGYFK